jgi:hypothetical protein
MAKFLKYRRILAGALAVLFLVSFSGFSTVLHSCLMGGSACCESMNGASSDTRATALSRSMNGCCSVKIAGGLNTNPVISEKQVKDESADIAFALLPQSAWYNALAEAGAHSPIASSLDTSPPTLERYVLTSAYLL